MTVVANQVSDVDANDPPDSMAANYVATFTTDSPPSVSSTTPAELRAAFQREGVAADGALLGRLSWVLPDRALSVEIGTVLAAGYLRGADLWHLACALYLSPDPRELAFLTVDRQQGAVAVAMGFAGTNPESNGRILP